MNKLAAFVAGLIVLVLLALLDSDLAVAEELQTCNAKGFISCGTAVIDSLAVTDCFYSDSTGILKDYVNFWAFHGTEVMP